MAFEALTTTETSAGKAIVQALMRKILANFDYLYGQLGTIASSDIPNGSFEIDSESNGIPDGWTRYLYPGGSSAIATGGSASHGAQCVSLTHPGGSGNGGGYVMSDYVPCSGTMVPEVISLIHRGTVAGMHNKITVKFYDGAKVDLSADVSPYDTKRSPSSATTIWVKFVPPSSARFYRLLLVGGDPDTNVAGTVYFDRVTRHRTPEISLTRGNIEPDTFTAVDLTVNAWQTIADIDPSIPRCYGSAETFEVAVSAYSPSTGLAQLRIKTASGSWVSAAQTVDAASYDRYVFAVPYAALLDYPLRVEGNPSGTHLYCKKVGTEAEASTLSAEW